MEDYESYRTDLAIIFSERESGYKSLLKECYKNKQCFLEKNKFKRIPLCKAGIKTINNDIYSRNKRNR